MRIPDTTEESLVKNYNDTAKIHRQKYQMERVLMCTVGNLQKATPELGTRGFNDSMEILEVD
jgi:hypothetical protein